MREDCTSFAEKLTGLFSGIVADTMTVGVLRELDDLDVTLAQLEALSLIVERRKTTVGAIAVGLGVSHVAAVKLVEKLGRKELVTRNTPDSDHRLSEIGPTTAGVSLVRRVREGRVQRLARVLDAMAPEERRALVKGLEAFVTAALRNEGALDALCVSCQTVHPTDCVDFRLIESRELAWGPGKGAPGVQYRHGAAGED